MTAEIVVMSRSAIALAADSAFTVQSLFEDETNQRIPTDRLVDLLQMGL